MKYNEATEYWEKSAAIKNDHKYDEWVKLDMGEIF